jgi:potassium-dependent mechanosensitive channel
MRLKGNFYRLIMALAVLGALVLPAAGAQVAHPQKAARKITSPQSLPKALTRGIAHLQKSLKQWQTQVAAATEKLAQTQEKLVRVQVAVASVKATMALKKLSLVHTQELVDTYNDRVKQLKSDLKEQEQEIETLKKHQQNYLTAENSLRAQIAIIQNKAPQDFSAQAQQLYLNYLKLAGARDKLVAQVIDRVQQRRQLMLQVKEIADGLAPELEHLEKTWKAELLRRPTHAVPLWKQIWRAVQSLISIPARAWGWLSEKVKTGQLIAFIWQHLAPIIGLLVFVLLMGWSTRRLNALVTRRFEAWKEQAEDWHMLAPFAMGQILITHLFGLGLILWIALFFWTLSLMGFATAQLFLIFLATLWTLRVLIQWVQAFFAGSAAGGILTLEEDLARFYRRSLKLFLVYLALGFLALISAKLLEIPQFRRMLLEHFFLLGVLIWGWWLLRRTYLSRLLPALSEPTWIHLPVVSYCVRGLLLFLIVFILLADLLGFQNLSLYLARAAASTLLAAAVLWCLWLLGETFIYHLLHPEDSMALQLYPERTEPIRRLYSLSRWILSLGLAAMVILLSLKFWGIPPQRLAWAFQWVTWGPKLGPVKLTILRVLGVFLALYFGFLFSRVLRSLVSVKIFPHMDLEAGVQYTISATVNYIVMIIAVLIGLAVLGIPMTSLALVAGALGVGIGFGLQNIVNNFISGLILLFERPIKVGDMLVVDDQWGLVKEIRVRSTIFETFDRYVLIIPNSELISNKVLNWTRYGAGINRLTLKVGVSYGSDPLQVTQIITEVCRANPRVVPEPPPQVFFNVYGDSSLDFTIWVHLYTPSDRIPATHEINSAIFEAFRKHGIEIPFPQRDLHIKQWPEKPEKLEKLEKQD